MSEPLLARELVLILPLIAGVIYACAALILNVALAEGISPGTASALANVANTVVFLFFVPWGEPLLVPGLLPRIVALGVTFWVGQLFTAWSLSRGEVSIATPVLSSKVVIVAWLVATVLHEPLRPAVWGAGLLTCAGIACLHLTDTPRRPGSLGASVGYGLIAAVGFAAFEVMVQAWSPRFGFGRIVPGGVALATLLSLPLLGPPPAWQPRRPKRRLHLVAAVSLIGLQSALFVSAIGFFGRAAEANVAYGSRGLWSLVAVRLLGARFGLAERRMSPFTFRARACGASLIVAAIGLMLWP